MKVSKINLDGNIIDVKDSKALIKPNGSNEGDLLVYDSEHDVYLPFSSNEAIGLLNKIKDQNKPISSSAVFESFYLINNNFRAGIYDNFDEIQIKFDYIQNDHLLRAKAYLKEQPYAFEIKDKLDILVVSLNYELDGNDVPVLDNVLGILTIDTTQCYTYDEITSASDDLHYSGTMEVPNYTKNKILYFIVLNQITDKGQIRRCINNSLAIGLASSNEITISSSDVDLYETQLNINLSRATTQKLNLKLTICDGRYGEIVKVKNVSVAAGGSSLTTNIGESGFTRKVYVELLNVDSSDNDYRIINPIIEIAPKLPKYLLLLSCIANNVFVQVCDRPSNIFIDDIISNYTKYENIDKIIETVNINGGTTLKPTILNYGNIPTWITIPIDGTGHTAEYWAEDLGIDVNDIPFSGNNIFKSSELDIERFEVSFEGLLTPYTDNINAMKYYIINHQHFEIWIVNEEGYLIDTYESKYNHVLFNANN